MQYVIGMKKTNLVKRRIQPGIYLNDRQATIQLFRLVKNDEIVAASYSDSGGFSFALVSRQAFSNSKKSFTNCLIFSICTSIILSRQRYKRCFDRIR